MHRMMISLFRLLMSQTLVAVFVTILPTFTDASERRTDGPPGSEFGDFSAWDGQFQVGGRFGASILSNGDKTSLLLGADADYRPADLFGFKLSLEQALQKPRLTLIHFASMIHSEISNFRPYAFVGPGLSLVSQSETKLKFSMTGGVGGDFVLAERFSFGMVWSYYWIFDSVDTTTVAARVGYLF